MGDVLLVLFAAFILSPLVTVFLPYSLMWTYSRARSKGHTFPRASLIAAAGWSLGTVGAGIWETVRFRSGLASRLDVVWIPAIVLVVVILVTTALLVLLPHGGSRTFGPRPTKFSWHPYALLVAAAFLVIPVVIITLWAIHKVDVLWLWVSLTVCVPFSLGSVWYAMQLVQFETRIRTTVSMDEYLSEDPRPSVLYLRPFKMDYYVYAEIEERKSTFEHYFCQALREIGPFVALGNPEDYVPYLGGAVRLYASDTDWVQRLDELARRSCCIVVETARSENLRLEYEYVRREGIQEKLFVFTGHPELVERRWLISWQRFRFGALHIDWPKFSGDLATMGYDLGPVDPGLGSVFTFGADGRAMVLTTQAKEPPEFIDPIKAWIERREKIGRCVPMSCYHCRGTFYVFPAGLFVVRNRGCAHCGEGFNAMGRAVDRFMCRHYVISQMFIWVLILALPIGVGVWLPDGSWISTLWNWLGAPFILAEYFGIHYWLQRPHFRRIVRLYRKLANSGDTIAMTNLGILYVAGKGVSKDLAIAASWFLKAAELGEDGGMICLAYMYERGIGGLAENNEEAHRWYERAALLGNRVAKTNLERLQAEAAP